MSWEGSRKILHVDMDAFFAAVEIRDNPELADKPVAIGGGKRGVLCTCNYIARKFGLRSAMPTFKAKELCPEVLFIVPNFAKYKTESRKVHEVFQRFSALIEPLSLDEAFLDFSHHEDPKAQAQSLLQEIVKTTQLTASAGLAPNKFLAKVASDWKKPNGFFVIQPDEVLSFTSELPIRKIPGIGAKTEIKMQSLNIKTCRDLQRLSLTELEKAFGKWGLRLFELCRGQDNRPIEPERERKSLSVERTFAQDIATLEECLSQLPILLKELKARLETKDTDPELYKSLSVKVKFKDFTLTTVEAPLTYSFFEVQERILLNQYKKLLHQGFLRHKKPVRLLGVGVKFGQRDEDPQLELF